MIPLRARLWVELRMLAYWGTLLTRAFDNWRDTRRKLYAMAEQAWEKAQS